MSPAPPRGPMAATPAPAVVLALVAVLALAAPGGARAASVKASVDGRSGVVGAAITLTIRVDGARSVGRVRMPDLPAFDVIPAGTRSRSVRVNGRAAQQVLLTYYLYAREPGNFTVGAIGVDVDGATLWTAPLQVTVAAAKAPTGRVGAHFLEAFVEPREAYAGQPIVYHLRLGISANITNFTQGDPDWGGLIEEASLETDMVESYQVIDGRTYKIIEWRTPLFSLRPGTYEIGPVVVDFDQVVGYQRRSHPLFNDPIFQSRTAQLEPVHLETEAVTVEVRPLPEAGRPEAFSGLVGTARLMGELSRDTCEIGGSATLSLALQGSGNLQDVELEIEAPEGIKVYAEERLLNLAWGPDGPYGTVARRFDLVPLVPGQAIVPEVTLHYLDPVDGRYRSTSVGPFRLAIEGEADGAAHGAHSADLLVDDAALEMLNREPYPIALRGGWRRRGTASAMWALAGAALVLPLGAFGLAALVRRRQRRLADPDLQRRRRALRRARARLDDLPASDREAAAAAMEEAVRSFLARRGGLTAGALSPEELAERVREAGAPASAEALERWVAAVGAVRYAGRAEPGIEELAERARDLIDALDEELP